MGFKKNTPDGNAGCGACRVLSGLRNVHVGWIRRLRRIHQWRGADAGCGACRVLSGLRDCTCRVDKAFTPHPPVARCRCRMRRLPRLIRPTERTRRVDKAFTPHPPVRGADAGCGACRVLSGLRNVHVGWIRRLRRIHQCRGADAGCDACRVLSGLRNVHVG